MSVMILSIDLDAAEHDSHLANPLGFFNRRELDETPNQSPSPRP